MSSTHEPPQLLEPINLLEPLDLKQQDVAFPGRGENAATDVRAQPHFTRDMPRAPRESARRSPLKSVLLAAGALVCFGAGTLFSQLDILTPSDVGSSPTIATANHPPRPLAEGTSKTDDPIQTEGKSAHSDSNESNAEAASKVAATPQPTTSPPQQPAQDVSSAASDAGCTGSCQQQACPAGDANCLEGGAVSPAKALTNADGSAAIPAATAPAKTSRRARQAPSAQAADAEHADSGASNRVQPERTATGAGSREEERAESSRHSKRPAQRETAEKPSGAKRKVATESAAARRQNANRTSVGRGDFAWEDGVRSGNSSGPWQSRGRDQESNGWGDWGASDAPTARSARRSANVEQGVNWHTERGGEARWQERDWDRPASRRRDRSDEYGRDDDRRFKPGRDDFLMGRAERSEGWQTMVPSSRYRW